MKSLVAGGMHYIRTADGLEELYAHQVRPGRAAQHGRLPGGPRDPPTIPGSTGGDAQEAVTEETQAY